jgi:hypothetical protein
MAEEFRRVLRAINESMKIKNILWFRKKDYHLMSL